MHKHFLHLSLASIVLTIGALLSIGQVGQTLAQDTGILFPIRQDGQWGFIDQTGKVVIAPQFGDAYSFNDFGMAPVNIDGQWGFIDKTGKVIVPPMFEFPPSSSLDILPSFEDGLVFYLDADTHLLTEFQPPDTTIVLGQYDAVHHYKTTPLLAVERDKKWGFIDQSGKVVVDLKYDNAFSVEANGLLIVEQNKLYGYIDEQGKAITPIQFQSMHPFSEGLAAVEMAGQWGYIEASGKMVIAPSYPSDRPFITGLAAVKINNKWGFIDPTGSVVIQPTYDNVSNFQDGSAWVLMHDVWGMIDTKGNVIIPPMFNGIVPADDNLDFSYGYTTIPYPFREDAAPIRMNAIQLPPPLAPSDNNAGLIDRSGKFLLEAKYDRVRYAGSHLFAFEQDEKWGLVDNLGTIIIEPTFEDYSHDVPGCTITFSADRACVRLGGKYGFIDSSAKVVIQPKYDFVLAFENNLARVSINQPSGAPLMGYIDLNGNEVWPPSR